MLATQRGQRKSTPSIFVHLPTESWALPGRVQSKPEAPGTCAVAVALSQTMLSVALVLGIAICAPPPTVVNLAAAGAAGAAGALAVYPFDSIKTRLQSETAQKSYGGSGVRAALSLVRSEGLLSLYSGLGVQLTGVVPEKSIKLFVHDQSAPLLGEALSGALAGLCQVVATNPLEIVKVRLQLSSNPDSPLGVLQRLGAASNPLVLYTGAAACAARDSLFSAILFPVYASARTMLAEGDMHMTGALLSLTAGMLAAAPAAYLTTPADVVKTRLQEVRGERRLGDGRQLDRRTNGKPFPLGARGAGGSERRRCGGRRCERGDARPGERRGGSACRRPPCPVRGRGRGALRGRAGACAALRAPVRHHACAVRGAEGGMRGARVALARVAVCMCNMYMCMCRTPAWRGRAESAFYTKKGDFTHSLSLL